MLPKVETPIFETTIPSTGESVKFRPILVKEEKILMLASESEEFKDMISACSQIVQNCTFDKVKGSDLTMFDMQDLFIRIREASVGESQEFNLVCGNCEKTTKYELKLSDLKVKGLEDIPSSEIKVGDDFIVKMKFPSAVDVAFDGEQTDIDTVAKCIESIVTEDEETMTQDVSPEDLTEFIEDLPIDAMNDMRNFIRSMPVIEHSIDYDCPHCGEKQFISINGYEHFFA